MTLAQDIPIRILRIIEKSPVLQADLVNILNIRDQRVAEGVRTLLNTHKITRIRKGKTYLLSLNGTHKKTNISALLSNNIFAPCVGCRTDCSPEICDRLIRWIL